MPRYNETKVLPHTQEQMFDLVKDVKNYPEFVPWCKEIVVKEDRGNHLVVDLTAGNSFLSETYTSDIYLTPYEKIEVSQSQGPFKYLFNNWHFKTVEGGTEVTFQIEFEFSSFIFQKAIESVFMESATQMVEAFEERAEAVYGAALKPKAETVELA